MTSYLRQRGPHELQRITYLHPAGIVSYALLLPPSKGAVQNIRSDRRLPVMVVLHGAGVDVDGDQTRKALKDWPDLPAWVIVPSGVTTWSGDDWHIWGRRDVEAAVDEIPAWMQRSGWTGPGLDSNKWLVIGHSNGGQGVWHFISAVPDKIIGAAPLSGYTSIPAYVPYQMWNETPAQRLQCMHNAMQSTHHELLTGNFSNIPIYIQHGSADDNVPVFHSRRMNQLLSQNGHTGLVRYSELEGKGHWFEGIMTTPGLVAFYHEVLDSAKVPTLPLTFTLVVPNPAETGSRGGILVERLRSPDSTGVIEVDREPNTWHLTTSNVWRFRFVVCSFSDLHPHRIHIDKQVFDLSMPPSRYGSFEMDVVGVWHQQDHTDKPARERGSLQLGPLTSLLSSSGHFRIFHPDSRELQNAALQIARNLYQYFAADCELLRCNASEPIGKGHQIVIEVGSVLDKDQSRRPIKIGRHSISVDRENNRQWTVNLKAGMGAIFLSPLSDDRLEVVVWGNDDTGLRFASRLIPLLTGVGQPDFIVTSRSCAWQGLAGVLAVGMFTNNWRASEAAFLG